MSDSPINEAKSNRGSSWWVYIVRCSDATYYTGITTAIERRIDEHNGRKLGAKYTRARQPVQLVYQEGFENRSLATKQEIALKKLTRKQKQSLINGQGVITKD